MKASPLAKKMAKDMGYDISKIAGSGDHGRVTKKDIENFKPAAGSSSKAAPGKSSAPLILPAVVGKESF